MIAISGGSPKLGIFSVIFTFCGMVVAQTEKIPQQILSFVPYSCFHSLYYSQRVNFLHERWKILPSGRNDLKFLVAQRATRLGVLVARKYFPVAQKYIPLTT